jgi:hypothetical protein
MANVGAVDKAIRIVAGTALVVLTFVGPYTAVLYPWGLVGIVPLVTGVIGWCPLYGVLGIRTCRAQR